MIIVTKIAEYETTKKLLRLKIGIKKFLCEVKIEINKKPIAEKIIDAPVNVRGEYFFLVIRYLDPTAYKEKAKEAIKMSIFPVISPLTPVFFPKTAEQKLLLPQKVQPESQLIF